MGNRRGDFRRRDFRNDRFRRGFFPFYPYAIPDWIWLGPVGCDPDAQVYGGDDLGDFGCDDLTSEEDQPAIYGDDGGDSGQPPPPPPDYDQQPNDDPPPVYEPPAYDPPARHPSQIPSNQIATTIVFNDGRPSEQIHNYAVTPTTLYVLDQQHRDIPLDQIDVAATEKANRAAGIAFQVPQVSQ